MAHRSGCAGSAPRLAGWPGLVFFYACTAFKLFEACSPGLIFVLGPDQYITEALLALKEVGTCRSRLVNANGEGADLQTAVCCVGPPGAGCQAARNNRLGARPVLTAAWARACAGRSTSEPTTGTSV